MEFAAEGSGRDAYTSDDTCWPSWPFVPRPMAKTALPAVVSVTTTVCFQPHDSADTRGTAGCESGSTRTGAHWSGVLPMPSWPNLFQPQAYSVSAVAAMVCRQPPSTSSTCAPFYL